ncbi:MAG: PAS domain S-box protein [Flavobacteriaceae bacterium]
MFHLKNHVLKENLDLNTKDFNKQIDILVFDQDTVLSHINTALKDLSNYQFTLHNSTDNEEFKRMIKSLKPGIIISELHLNEVDGKEMLNYCRMVYPDIPYIIFSSHSCNKSALHFLELGAADFLTKENILALPATIYKVLRQSFEKHQIKEAKKQRWEDAQRFKGLIEHSFDPVITYNDSGEITYASPAIKRVLGYNVEEFIGTNVTKHIHPEDLIKRESKFKKLIQSSNSYATIDEERLLHKDGHYIWVKAIISDGRLIPGIQGFMTNFRDITETVKSKKALEKTLKDLTDYKIALDESSIVGIANLGGKIVYANEELVKISKFTGDELLGSDYRLFNSGEHSILFYLKIWNTISSGQIWKGELKLKAKDNTFFWVNMTVVPFLDNRNKPYQYIVVMRDITLRKLKTIDLHNTVDLLSNQNNRLLNFSYIVSHNLRSHTSNIQNLINYLEQTDDEEEKLEMMQHLKNVTNALDDTMYNLNEVVSIQSGTEMKIEEIPIKALINQVLKVLKSQISKSNAQIEIEVKTNLSVKYNRSYLESIFHNLILNSIKYKHPDRVPKIKIESRTENNFTILSISDNGIGIDLNKHKDKLFGMYKTFHNNNDSRGLGLFMSKNQIEAMGGKIEVSSQVDQGSTFEIYIKQEKPKN